MPAPVVWPLDESGCEEGGHLLTRAFVDDPFFRYAIPDPADRASQLPPFFAACLRYGCLFGRSLAVGRTPGRPEGVGWWYRFPEADFTPERTSAAGFDAVGELLGPASDRIAEVAHAVDAVTAQALPGRRCQLDQLGVDPASQGQGLGSALVQAILRDAELVGLPVSLWTVDPANLAFYRRNGFDVIADGISANGALPWWTLSTALPGSARRPAAT